MLKLMQMRIIETIQQRIFTRASLELSYRFPKIKMSEMRNYYLPELANRFFDTLIIQKGLSKILIDVPSALSAGNPHDGVAGGGGVVAQLEVEVPSGTHVAWAMASVSCE